MKEIIEIYFKLRKGIIPRGEKKEEGQLSIFFELKTLTNWCRLHASLKNQINTTQAQSTRGKGAPYIIRVMENQISSPVRAQKHTDMLAAELGKMTR